MFGRVDIVNRGSGDLDIWVDSINRSFVIREDALSGGVRLKAERGGAGLDIRETLFPSTQEALNYLLKQAIGE